MPKTRTSPRRTKADSQRKRILEHLLKGKTISPYQALDWFNCFRLGARIYDLKRAGHNITATRIKGSQAVKYSLV